MSADMSVPSYDYFKYISYIYSSFKSLFMGTLVFQKEHIDRPDVYVLKLLHGLCPVINLSSDTPNGVANPL